MKLLWSVTASASLLAAPTAHAALVSINFDSAEAYVVGANYLDSGFRFSPNLHYDIWGDTKYMGFDAAGGGMTNPDFLGAEAVSQVSLPSYPAYLYIDFDGKPFSLESLTIVTRVWGMVSSKGATFAPDLTPNPYDATFDSSGWKGIKWLLLYTDAGMPEGFDNFVARVPEPGSLALIGLGFSGLAALRRRKR